MEKALAFFGAFNPPTKAHLGLAELALRRTERQLAVFVPSQTAYIRDGQGKDFAYSNEARLAMLRAAAQSRPWMRICDWEMRQARQPRTYETLRYLLEQGIEAALLLGSDKLPELERNWLHVPEIAREHGIVCLSRGGDECERLLEENAFLRSLSPCIQIVETPMETRGVSSTAVRRQVNKIRELEAELAGWVPREILPML